MRRSCILFGLLFAPLLIGCNDEGGATVCFRNDGEGDRIFRAFEGGFQVNDDVTVAGNGGTALQELSSDGNITFVTSHPDEPDVELGQCQVRNTDEDDKITVQRTSTGTLECFASPRSAIETAWRQMTRFAHDWGLIDAESADSFRLR